jgi:hypothetical protein
MLQRLDDNQESLQIALELQKLLDQAEESLYLKAKFCADTFWENHMQLGMAGNSRKPSSLGCRIRRKGHSIYMEWYYNSWSKKFDGGFKPKSHHIGKPARNFQYSLSKLYARAPEWEYAMIKETELAFSNLRRQNHQLTIMRRSLKELTKLASDQYLEGSALMEHPA